MPKRMIESVLDQPRKGLDPAVWQKLPDGSIYLTADAKMKILKAVKWLIAKYQVDFNAIHLIGSITSNSYTDDSDIDIHVCANSIPTGDEMSFNKTMKQDYWDNYYPQHEQELLIGSHPIELYVQLNQFKNMASVGCYDVITDEWLVGPDMTDMSFDPYKEYYDADMDSVKFLIDDIRNQILSIYEIAVVILKSKDQSFISQKVGELTVKLASASELLDLIKQSRSVIENPVSKEDALTKRASRKWKIADSTFKLLSKFGYIGILSKYASVSREIAQTASVDYTAICKTIVGAIQENFSTNSGLDETERNAFNQIQSLDEGLKDWLKGAAVAGAIAAGSMGYSAQSPDTASHQDRAAVVQHEKSYKGLSQSNLKNMLANVAYNEAGSDWVKTRDDDALIAILNIIDHRSGGNPDNYATEMTRPSQFFGAKYVVGKDDAKFTKFDPNAQAKKEGGQLSKSQKTCWDKCNAYAEQLLKGELKDVLTTTLDDGTVVKHNMIANAKKDNKAAYDSWGKACGEKLAGYVSGYDARPLGHHTFGYQPDQDGDVKYNHAKPVNLAKKASKTANPSAASEYTVKNGDTLGKIAAAHKTTVKAILAKNSSTIKNPDKIRPGQKIRI